MSGVLDDNDTDRIAEFKAGWRALAGGMLGLATSPTVLIFYSFGAFIKDLQAAFGWTRAQTSIGFVVCQISIAIATPCVGWMMDRLGVKRPVAISLLGAALGFALLGTTVTSLPLFLALMACTAFVSAAGSPVAYTRVINGWFSRSRGLALGIALTGTGMASFIAPSITTAAIGQYGWRGGYLSLSVLIIVALPLIMLLLREPGPAISTASGSSIQAARAADPASHSTPDKSFQDAVRGRVFWQVLIACTLHAIAVAGLVTHFQSLLTDTGIASQSAATVAGMIGIAVVIGRVLTGALLDRFFAPRIVALLLVFTTLACLTLLTRWPAAPYVAALAIGLSVSTEVDILSYLVARYFGLRSYGRLYGTIFGAMLVGSALSTYLTGASFDAFGSYDAAVTASAILMALVIVLLCFLPRFERVDG